MEENYSLIANSGIQFYNCRLDIQLQSSIRHIFHEWFDPIEINHNLEFAYRLPQDQSVYRWADMEHHGFLDEDGKLKVAENDVLTVPNIKPLEADPKKSSYFFEMGLRDCKDIFNALKDKWIPLPYFEEGMGSQNGPFDWVRCKLIPRQSSSPTTLSFDVLVAFDTRAVYNRHDKHPECPCFNSESCKNYSLSGKVSDLLSFCSGQNSWVRGYLMNLVYGTSDVDAIPFNPLQNQYRYLSLAAYFLLIQYMAKSHALPTVRLIRDRGEQHIDVQMIIDIGNSRTAALLFEEGDFTKVKPLHLQNFTFPITPDGKLNITQESFDMRIAFQKVSFGEMEKPDAPNTQFIWPSMVRLGAEANYLTHETVGQADGNEILSTYSSPKRYLWDYKPRQEEWRCVKVNADGKNEMPKIEGINSGEDKNFFNNDGSINLKGQGRGLHYSRRTLMTFAFMEIFTQARVQINSYEFRKTHWSLHKPRRIENIILTCPTAMSKEEQRSLHDSLNEALLVLNKFQQSLDPSSPALEVQVTPDLSSNPLNPQWIFDEATCSQFVYLYGKFSKTYLNNSHEFFSIYGKKRPDAKGKPVDSLVIGSLDIGAGTSDVMVCRYEYDLDNPSRLKPIPQFWDSFDYAGDDMMKVLIENVLLQGRNGIIEQELAKKGKEETEAKRLLYNFFGSDHNALSYSDRILRRDFNLQVCVPIMNHFLDLLSKDIQYRSVSFDDIFANNIPSEAVLKKFEQHFGFDLKEIHWTYDSKLMSTIIERTMNDLLENIATIMCGEQCDLVIISGRPSSLPPIKEVILRYFGVYGQTKGYQLEPDRLIVLNKHDIGRWYPYVDESGYLTNSKSVVPVGAMIGYLASNAGGIEGFSLDLSALGELLKPTTEYFILRDGQMYQDKYFITPDENHGEFIVNSLPVYIGSKRYNLPIYPARPFYVLEFDENSIISELVKKAQKQAQYRSINSEVISFNDDQKHDLLKAYLKQLKAKFPITFELDRTDYYRDKESLRITAVRGADGMSLPCSDFTLTIQSLNDPDCYWLDSGAFNINIKATR